MPCAAPAVQPTTDGLPFSGGHASGDADPTAFVHDDHDHLLRRTP
ncbi:MULTISPECIES: hypothetical protein [Streptomyces]